MSEQKGFFREKSGACAKIGTVLLLVLLTLCLLGTFVLHTAAFMFEQRGLERLLESFLQTDEVRGQVADVIRDTFPDELIADAQVDSIVNDDAIMEAVGSYIYEALRFEGNGPESLSDHMLSVLEDPASASLYNEALDHFTAALGIEDEAYRAVMEAIAEEQQITLPEGTTDKLALTAAILRANLDGQQELLSALTTDLPEFSTSLDPLGDLRRALVPFETPRFVLFNLLALAVFYGILLLINRNYRRPFLHCCIPYFITGAVMLLFCGAVPALLSFRSGDIAALPVLLDLISGAFMRSGLMAFGFAAVLLIAFIVLTVVKKKRAFQTEIPVGKRKGIEQISA